MTGKLPAYQGLHWWMQTFLSLSAVNAVHMLATLSGLRICWRLSMLHDT